MSVTLYGFKWGPMVVERVAHVEKRGYCIEIRGPKGYDGPRVQVYVSEKGKIIEAIPMNGARSRLPRRA